MLLLFDCTLTPVHVLWFFDFGTMSTPAVIMMTAKFCRTARHCVDIHCYRPVKSVTDCDNSAYSLQGSHSRLSGSMSCQPISSVWPEIAVFLDSSIPMYNCRATVLQ